MMKLVDDQFVFILCINIYIYLYSIVTSPWWYSLVDDGGVRRAVFVDHRHHERDELGPEVQVLDGGALLLAGQVLLAGLDGGRREGPHRLNTERVEVGDVDGGGGGGSDGGRRVTW